MPARGSKIRPVDTVDTLALHRLMYQRRLRKIMQREETLDTDQGTKNGSSKQEEDVAAARENHPLI